MRPEIVRSQLDSRSFSSLPRAARDEAISRLMDQAHGCSRIQATLRKPLSPRIYRFTQQTTNKMTRPSCRARRLITNSIGRRSFRMHGPVITSEARNPGQKTKISQSQPLTSFETRSFEMTKVDLCWLSGGFQKRPHARLCGPHSDRNFENPYNLGPHAARAGRTCAFARVLPAASVKPRWSSASRTQR